MANGDLGWLEGMRHTLGHYLDAEMAADVLAGSEQLSNKSSAEETTGWIKGMVGRLEALVDEGKRVQVLAAFGHDCAKMHSEQIDGMVARRRAFDTLEAYLEAEEESKGDAYWVERKGSTLYVHYKPGSFGLRCFCSLWHGLSAGENTSLTWCHCGRGHVEATWEAVLGRPVQVEVLGSSIAGEAECTFAVHLA